MSLFGEVAGQRFFLGTQYRWDPIIARTWAGFYPRGLVSSSPEVVAAAATREFAPLVLLDTFNGPQENAWCPSSGNTATQACVASRRL